MRIATVLQYRSTTAISKFVFLNYSLPNSTNHLTKLNLILEMVSECKILSVWWWELGWKTLPPALVRFRGGKRVTTFRRNGSKYSKNSFVSEDWVITSKESHPLPNLIRTLLSFSIKLLYTDGSIYIIHTTEVLYWKFCSHYKSIHKMWQYD